MKRKLLLLTVLVISYFFMAAQTLRHPAAAGYAGMGVYSINHADAFSFTINQASLARLKTSSAGIYMERKFLLAELTGYTGAGAIVTQSGNIGLKINYAGFTGYRETVIGLAYGRKLGSKADVGCQFNYHGLQLMNGYGKASAVSFELGTMFHLSDRLHTGFHINNPVGGKFGKEGQEKLPTVISFGIGYEASVDFLFSIAIEKEEQQPVNVNAGLEYKFKPVMSFRAGIATATSTIWWGVGLMLRSFRVDLTASYHPVLGISPGILLLVNFRSAGEN